MSNYNRAPESNQKKYHGYSLQLNRWFLILIGAWPQINASSKIFILIQVLFCWSVVASMTVPCLIYVLFEKISIKTKLKALGPLIHRAMGIVNYCVLLKRSGDISKLIRHMEADWSLIQKTDNCEVMLQHAKLGRFITIICGVIMQGGVFLFSLARAMKTVPITVDNQTFMTHPMTCPIYSKIIDTRFSPVNEVALALQFVSMFIMNCSSVGVCSLAAVFAIHACGQLNVLYAWLHKLVEEQEKSKQTTKRKLAAIVEHHLRVLSFVSLIEDIMNTVSLAQLMGCTTVMCLIGYYMIMAWETLDAANIISCVFTYLSYGFNIFIFCYIGEIVTEKCKYVGEMAYMTNWHDLHHKTARGLVLIILQSSNVVKITAGKLINLSFITFGDVIKSSMVYLNILRAMTT